jgi:magnesium transporter
VFRILDVHQDGQSVVGQDLANVSPPKTGCIRWIDLVEQDAAKLRILAERFRFHPLAIEDCLHFDQRPKLESYSDHMFLVIHGFRVNGDKALTSSAVELHIFLGRDFLVTVHECPLPELDAVWSRLVQEGNLLQRGADYVCYLIADALIDGYFPVVDGIMAKIDQLEDRVLDVSEEVNLHDILDLKRLLVEMRRVLSPQRDVLALLTKRGEGWINEHTAIYFRDVYDHVLRLHEAVESAREMVANTRDAYLWSASQRTNEIMKRLTILSAIFLPLTFLTGFFGQNFEHMPFGSYALMIAMLASCALIPAGMIYYFIKSKWFA